jgi:hypothetical protein
LNKKEKSQVTRIAKNAVKKTSDPKHFRIVQSSRLDVDSTLTNSNTTIYLNNIPQGVQNNQRIGSRVYLDKLYLSGNVLIGKTASGLARESILRMILVRTNEPKADWDQDRPAFYGTYSDAWLPFIEKVYFDKTIYLNPGGQNVAGYARPIDFEVNLNGALCEFPGDGTSSAARGALVLCVISNITGPAGEFPSIQYDTKLVFRDP